jgi:hypothetical protein
MHEAQKFGGALFVTIFLFFAPSWLNILLPGSLIWVLKQEFKTLMNADARRCRRSSQACLSHVDVSNSGRDTRLLSAFSCVFIILLAVPWSLG